MDTYYTHSLMLCLSGGFFYGYSTAIVAGALSGGDGTLSNWIELDDVRSELITTSLLVGSFLSCLVGGPISDSIGRKKTLIVFSVIAMVGTLGMAFVPTPSPDTTTVAPMVLSASSTTTVPLGVWLPGSFWFLTASRFVQGLGVGVMGYCIPLYSSEVVEPQKRGPMSAVFQLSVTFGILGAYIVNEIFLHVTAGGWRWEFILTTLPIIVVFYYSLKMWESPRWMRVHGLRVEDPELPVHLVPADLHVQAYDPVAAKAVEPSVSMGDFCTREFLKPFGIGTLVAMANQLTGINSIIYYGPVIIQNAGVDETWVHWIVILIGLWNMITTAISIKLIGQYGRRELFLSSTGALCVCLLGIGIGLDVIPATNPSAMAGVALPFIFLFVMGFEFGSGPLFYGIASEIFSTKFSGVGAAMVNNVMWIFNIGVSLTFLTLQESVGIGNVFLIYLAFGVVSFIGLYVYLPETKDRTLDEIQQEIMGYTPVDSTVDSDPEEDEV